MTHSREARPPRAGDMPNQHHSEPWRRRFVPARLRRERLAGQVVRFGIVGVLNTVVDFGLLNVLYHVVGLPLLVANTISVSAGIVNSFLWNKHWTFSAGGWSQWRREAVVFVGVSFVGLLINDIGIYALHSLWGETGVLAVNAQKLGASVFSMGWNFVGYRLIAFRGSAGSPSEGSP
ncbi:MAG: GtrA family protein [Thermoleophilia bacterium]